MWSKIGAVVVCLIVVISSVIILGLFFGGECGGDPKEKGVKAPLDTSSRLTYSCWYRSFGYLLAAADDLILFERCRELIGLADPK